MAAGFDVSEISVINENDMEKNPSVAGQAQQAEDFVSQFHGFPDPPGGEFADFFKPVIALSS